MQFGQYVVLFAFMLTSVSVAGQFFSSDDIIDRHNYGYMLYKKKEVQFMTAEVKMVFHYKLPDRVELNPERMNCSTVRTQRQNRCQVLSTLIHAFQALRASAHMHLQHQLDDIYDIVQEFPQSQKRGVWSDILSDITGLATSEDLSRVNYVLRQVERGVARAADIWSTGTSHFVAAYRVMQRRTNNIYSLLNAHEKSILELRNEVLDEFFASSDRSKLMAKMMNSLAALIFQHSEIDNLYSSLQILNSGKIPHFFLHHDTLTNALNFVKTQVVRSHPELMLLREDLRFYYEFARFRVFRFHDHLMTLVNVPLTTRKLAIPLHLYRFVKIPLQSPGSDEHYTVLSTQFKAVIFGRDSRYYLTVEQEDDVSDVVDLRHTTLQLRRREVMSCAVALIDGLLSEIKSRCQYHVITAALPTQIFQLSADRILFSNIATVSIECPHQNITSDVNDTVGRQVIYHLKCGCSVMADDYVLALPSLECHHQQYDAIDFDVKLPINLPFLSEFFSESELDFLNADSLLNTSLSVHLPTLAIASEKYKHELEIRDETAFEMQSIINKTKQDSKAFRSLSHFLYNTLLTADDLNEDFDVFNFLDWLILIASLAAGVAIIWLIILHLKLRTVMILLSASRRVSAAPTLSPRLHYSMATVQTEAAVDVLDEMVKYQRQIQEILPVDVTLLMILLVAILVLIIYGFYRLIKRREVSTRLILEIGDGKRTFRAQVLELAFNANAYRFEVDSAGVQLRCHEMFCTALIYWTDGLVIHNVILDLPVVMSSKITIAPWNVTKIREIMRGHHYVILRVRKFEGEEVEVVILKRFQSLPALALPTAGVASVLAPPVYPSLS